MRTPRPALGIALIIGSCSCFASMDSVVRYLGGFLPVLLILWARYSFQALAMALWLGWQWVKQPGAKPFHAAHPKFQAMRGMLLLATSAICFYGVQQMPVAEFTAINMLSPVLITLLAGLLLKEQVSALRWTLVIGGFAGATADAMTLFERLELKLEQYPSQLTRACVEMAKDWRTDRYLRRLEAMMIVADKSVTLVLTGTGDVLEPEKGIIAIGSGGNYALAAARALADGELDAESIARKAMAIAAEICVYTNNNLTIETLATA